MFSILKNKNFVALWVSQICSVLAIHLVNFTLVVRLYELRSSAFMIGLLMVAISLPGVLLVPVAGALADRLDRKKVLIITNLIQACTMLAYVLFLGNMWGLLLVALINSSIAQFYVPAEAATMPTLVNKDELVSANSLFAMTLYGGFIIGYTLAGPLVIIGSITTPFYIAGASLLIAAIATMCLPPDRGQKKLALDLGGALTELKADISEGWVYIQKTPTVLFPVIRFAASISMLYVLLVVFPSFAKDVLKINIADLSHVLIGPTGIGLIIGSLTASSIIKRYKENLTINIGLTICGIFLIALTYYQSIKWFEFFPAYGGVEYGVLPIASFIMIILGWAAALILIPTQTEIQKAVRSEVLGRVYGSIYLTSNIVNIPLVLFAGSFVDLFSAKRIILALAIIALFIGVKNWVFYFLNKYLNISEVIFPRS